MKVLVVDDSQLNLAVAKRYLNALTEISEVFLCHNPSLTKDIIDTNQIDILILDILMPDITGLDILALLRADPRYDDLPIIMLTSLNDPESYKQCFELGAFDYINKPIHMIEFLARLRVAIGWKNNSKRLNALIEVTQKQNEELKEMNAKLTEAKFSLVQSEKMAAIGQLAAGIAHEINNPMGFITSNFDMLKKYFQNIIEYINYVTEHMNTKELDPSSSFPLITEEINNKYHELKLGLILKELEGIFQDSSEGIIRVTEIVQSLRVFARSSTDDEKDTNVLIDLIRQVLLITKSEINHVANIEIDVAEDIIIYCNRIQIGQVFVNIMLNAAQAIASEKRDHLGNIKIKAEKKDHNILITFEDDGPGIFEAYLGKIFEPFFTTKDIGQGTGLGLSISYDIIVNKHHGSIEARNRPEKGAIFLITLPIITSL